MVDPARRWLGITAFCNALTREPPAGIARGIDLDDESSVAALFAREQADLMP